MIMDFDNIILRSYNESIATLQCMPNASDTGFAFVRVRNLTIKRLNFKSCAMKHNSTTQYDTRSCSLVSSAVFIQNSSNIFLSNIIIANSNGTGLLIYDTNGSVHITNSMFIDNTLNLNLLEDSKKFVGGGGIYIEFTNCTPGLIECDSNNLYNRLLPSFLSILPVAGRLVRSHSPVILPER